MNSIHEKAYELGKSLKTKFDADDLNTAMRYYDSEITDIIESNINIYDSNLLWLVDLGFQGYEKPEIVTGWRYGNLPKGGYSYNYREDRKEKGCSVAWLDNQNSETIDLVSLAFIADGRSLVHVRGYLNPMSKGSDGEPLLMYAHKID